MIRKIVPDVISGQTLQKVTPRDSVRAAAKMMRDKKIAAVLVMSGYRLVGIITASCAEIMPANPDTLSPDDTTVEALNMMRERNYRHLPVVKAERVVGMVSVRDLYAAYKTELEQDLKDRNAFIYGESYGGMA